MERMTTPKDPDEVIAPVVCPKGHGNPLWVKGGVSPNPGGPNQKAVAITRTLKSKIRTWLDEVGFERLTEIAMDSETDPAIASGIILKLSGFVLPPPKVDELDGASQDGAETRTMIVTFVAPRKD